MATRVIDYSRCKPDILDRFWGKVDRSGDCWEWTATVGKNGYGKFGVYKGLVMSAHRFIDIAFNGDVDESQFTLHKCDNKKCVRPSHLFRGTQKQNIHDAMSKGRASTPPANFGDKNHATKLTHWMIADVYRRYDSGESIRSISNLFGVAYQSIWAIIKDESRSRLKGG